MKYEFQSSFAAHISDMLTQRSALGRDIREYQSNLANFDRFCVAHYPCEAILTQEIVFAWCNNARGNAGANRASVIRGFGRYLNLKGVDAYILPLLFFPYQNAGLPYIFTDRELKLFFEATDRYPHYSSNPLLEYTIPVIFRLQYACGMRPQEVRRLRKLDMDFSNNTIYIADGKHNKDRKLAACTDIMKMCRNYDRIAEAIIPSRTYFFQSPTGKAYTSSWLTRTFHNCWRMSGNGNERGSCTPYDLRHNYASQTLMRWVEEGKDLDAWIPYLSAYMGHECFSSTYYYIHMLPERLARMDFTHTDGIIPEVDYEETH